MVGSSTLMPPPLRKLSGRPVTWLARVTKFIISWLMKSCCRTWAGSFVRAAARMLRAPLRISCFLADPLLGAVSCSALVRCVGTNKSAKWQHTANNGWYGFPTKPKPSSTAILRLAFPSGDVLPLLLCRWCPPRRLCPLLKAITSWKPPGGATSYCSRHSECRLQKRCTPHTSCPHAVNSIGPHTGPTQMGELVGTSRNGSPHASQASTCKHVLRLECVALPLKCPNRSWWMSPEARGLEIDPFSASLERRAAAGKEQGPL